MKQPIDKLVDETMESLDHIQRATPRPFLMTRINAALNKGGNFWTRAGVMLSRPVNAIAGILIVLLVNAIVISQVNKGSQSQASVKEDFVVNVATIYDIENPEP